MFKETIKRIVEKLFWKYYEEDIEPAVRMGKIDSDIIFGSLLKDNEDLKNLLRSMLKGDKDNYFRAGDEKTRLKIKGAYLRTLYFLRKMERLSVSEPSYFLGKVREKVGKKIKVDTKIGNRYG
ncbi:hypothetical protein DRN43_04650 [Thermococci archaeon]|nr:MAG: hypothetical protein DRN43_04650 [Thermococci archaeon]